MFGLRQAWHRLKEAPPGDRFQQQYRAHQASRRSRWSKLVAFTIGALVMAAGVVALPAPGPGTLVLAFGAAILARESEGLARALDWIELRLRRAATMGASAWRRASPLDKVVVVGLAAGSVGLVALGAYRIIAGN